MAIILAAIILFTSFTPVVATENSTTQTENKKVQWLVENNFLVGRGKDGDLKLGSSITRAEFTRMALVAKGEEDAAKEYPNVSTKFKDVDENHWATKLISYASEKGYISGYPDGNFKPEGDITYEEIISILVRIHPNYTKIEAKSVNWAEGFINFAAENGILEGLKIESSYKSPAIREKTFEMIYNFINIENNHVKETKSTKPIETKNENYFGWNGFYPYWFQFGYRSKVEKPIEPEVKPEPGIPDVKPEPEEPKEPETPETPKEFDKDNITKIEVKNQPTKLVYTEGDKLDLTGLEVTLIDNQGLTKDVEFKDFEEYGLKTSPENETPLTMENNGKTVVISKDEVKAETEALTVKEKVFDPEHVETITVKIQPKLNYTEDEKLDLSKLVVILKDNQDLTKEIEFKDFKEYGITTKPENGAELKLSDNAKTVEISKGEAKAETEALKVNPKVFDPEHVETITVKTQPKLTYTEGDKLDLMGLVVSLTDNQGLTEEIGLEKFGEYGITTDPKNGTPLTVTDHNGKSVVITKGEVKTESEALKVNPKVFDKENITKIEVKIQPEKQEYTEGESLDLTGLVVKLTDNQGLTKDVEFKDFEENGLTTDPANGTALTVTDHNGKTVKISKGEVKTETNALTVKAKVFDPEHVEKITVKTQPTKLVYTDGDKLDLTGLVVKLTDNQELTKDVSYEEFSDYGITTEPTNGTELKLANNDTSVVITKGELKIETEELTVNAKVFDKDNITKIEVKDQPKKLVYIEEESLDLTGLVVKLTDNQGLTEEIGLDKFGEYGIATEPTNGTPLTVTDHNGNPVEINKGEAKVETNALTVKAKVFNPEHVETITVKIQPKLNYTEDEKLDLSVLEVTLIDNQGLTKEIGLDKFGEYGLTASPANGTPLTVTDHNGNPVIISKGEVKAETNALTVNSKVFDKDNITKIEVISKPNLTYKVNDILDLRGLNVKITDDQGLEKEVELANFQDYGITTDPANKTQLKIQHDKTRIKVSNDQVEVPSESNPLILRIVKENQFNEEKVLKRDIKNSLTEVYKNLGDIKLGIDNFENKYYIVIPRDINSAKFNKEGLKASILNVIKTNKINSYNILGTQRDLYEGESAKPDDEILKILREDILKIAGLEENPDSTDEEILKNLKEKLPETKLKFTSENIEFDYEIVFLNPIDERKLEKIEEDFIAHMEATTVEVKNAQKDNYGFTVSYENKNYNVKIHLKAKENQINYFHNYGYIPLITNFLTGEKVGPNASMKNLKSIAINTKSKPDNRDNDKMNVDNWGAMDRLELENLLPSYSSKIIADTRSFLKTFPCKAGNIEYKGSASDLTGYDTIIEYFYVDKSTNTGGIITRIIRFSF